MDVELAGMAGFAYCAQYGAVVAANDLLFAIDDDLRRVDAIETKAFAIGVLPVGVGCCGIGVGPALIVPVGDVFADTDDELSSAGMRAIDLS